MAYIYKITNNINNKIYIGKTEFSIEKRFAEHCSDAFRDRNEKRPLYAAMRKYGIENFEISLIEETNSPEEREIYWISYYDSYKNGYNATLGGDGKKYIDYDLVVETYLKLLNIKQVANKLNLDAGHVSHILKSQNIQIIVPKSKKCKAINQYDKNNKLIRSFYSCGEAARWLFSQNISQAKIGTITNKITDCCRGERKSAYGFYWQFV